MRIPTWRLLLTGGAIAVLGVAGIGFVAASGTPAGPVAQPGSAGGVVAAADADLTVEAAAEAAAGERLGWRPARWLRLGRHLVHAEATITGADDELITIWLDHGTVRSIGGGSLTIAEAGGGSKTVATDETTIVYVGREDGSLDDVTAGAEVFVQSRVTDDDVLARRILVIPPKGD